MIKGLVLGMIRFYQRFLSPLKPRTCRFFPSCSCYARHSIEKYGLIKGSRLALWRLLRCHPFHPGGFDPVG
ncbi:MAG: membrane protein insertion efficiency factor YidD [Thermodesulfobacteriota bacterium]